MLKRVAQVVGLDIKLIHIPAHYRIALRFESLLSQKQSELVFSLTESNENIEFSKRTFTIEAWNKSSIKGFPNFERIV